MTRRALLSAIGSRTRILSLQRFPLAHNDEKAQVIEYLQTLPGPLIHMEAILAPHVPQLLSIGGFHAGDPESQIVLGRIETAPTPGQLLEFRSWRLAWPQEQLNAILARHGLHPIFSARAMLGPECVSLIPLKDLATRGRAWEAFAADRDWIRLRQKGQGTIHGIMLYRAL